MSTTTSPQTSLTPDALRGTVNRLKAANQAFMAATPGESSERQPVHTVYGGAQLWKADTVVKMGATAVRALTENAPNATTFAKAIGLSGAAGLPEELAAVQAMEAQVRKDGTAAQAANLPAWLAVTIYDRVLEKLKREAVEDFRIDFEDGYGNRPDEEEDRQAGIAAQEVARGLKEGTLPPFIGIRIKPFTEELRERSMRTLDIFVTTLVKETGGQLPANFVITHPKLQVVEHVSCLVEVLELLEANLGLTAGTLKIELMVETPQSIFNDKGEMSLPILVKAGKGRITGAHFGTYDYTAGVNITALHQRMDHPACDFARHAMQVALAGSGVFLSDGATNVMPVAPHRGEGLTQDQLAENRAVVHRAWKLHYDHCQHSLINAYYQGWDLHPAQLSTRYAAVYAFFLEGLPAATARLKNFIEKAAQATLVGDVFDDAATGQGLLNFFLRGINCGALTEEEALITGLTLDELRGRSFVKILANRRGK
ncbi:MAG: Pyruvate/Phosphoenolpyruvate kinase domain protein [Cyanobacteria bacterium RYN_339]|nr:Pyruvate/Phosphoenolpyruvate kinase domain protein [Cyanobacteria bacterium RYN_339]